MSIKNYAPFITSFVSTLGVGVFALIIYVQHGGLVSQTYRTGHSPDEAPAVTYLDESVIDLPEVRINAKKHKTFHKRSMKPIAWQCRLHELQQGGLIEERHVKVCEHARQR